MGFGMTDNKNEIWRFLEQLAVRFPVVVKGLRCGALNRQGKPCRSKQLYKNGRCRYHGGCRWGLGRWKGSGALRSICLMPMVDHIRRYAELMQQRQTARTDCPPSLSDGRKAGPQHKPGVASHRQAEGYPAPDSGRGGHSARMSPCHMLLTQVWRILSQGGRNLAGGFLYG